jgi:hypothetical protein
MEYETAFLVIAALLSFSDLALLFARARIYNISLVIFISPIVLLQKAAIAKQNICLTFVNKAHFYNLINKHSRL